MLPLIVPLVVALSSGAPASGRVAAAGSPQAALRVAVPYVPQTQALCGGAAVAMVYRYWGVPHASAQEFAPLVDWHALGIRTDVLVAAVQKQFWIADTRGASFPALRAALAAGHPAIVLIEYRPQRFHYVVVVGLDDRQVIVHDPEWGPGRAIDRARFARQWAASDHWSVVILPTALAIDGRRESRASARSKSDSPFREGDACARRLDAALDAIERDGLDRADAYLERVRTECPAAAGPVRELAGVRFAQHRWREAAALAEQAAAVDGQDEYTWDVLGSSRFMQDDLYGALAAWNHIGKPRVDAVSIQGLTRTRYSRLAGLIGLESGSLLTPEQLRLAERRLESWPDASSVRIGFRPAADGFAAVDVAVVQPPARPHAPTEWIARGVETVVTREVGLTVPGANGEGEVWNASWRWWENRPRAAMSFAVPKTGRVRGVWRVEAEWERQTFQPAASAPIVREERLHGGLVATDWLTSNLRYDLAGGIDAWNGVERAIFAGGGLEQRALDDRLSIAAAVRTWLPMASADSFHTVRARTTLRSTSADVGTVWQSQAGFDWASGSAPMSVWPGAGEGLARDVLLRGHALLDDGVIAGGMFGHQLAHANEQVTRWIGSLPIRVGVAAFADLAHVAGRPAASAGAPFQIDAGVGLRMRAATNGTLRIDFGRGLRDGSHAFTIAWQR